MSSRLTADASIVHLFDKIKSWNPIIGCSHKCVYCWANRLAKTRLKHLPYYRDFTPNFLEERLYVKFKSNELIFVTNMGDLYCDEVPKAWIRLVIEKIRCFQKTYFLFLTKNPKRYLEFLDVLPNNVILGATIETDDDELYRKYGISRAPLPSERYRAMLKAKEVKPELRRHVSIEPILDFNLSNFLKLILDIEPLTVYVGYDNYNNRLPEPNLSKTLELMDILKSNGVHVLKGTIRRSWNE